MFNFIALECKINHYYCFSKIVNVNYNKVEFNFQKFTHSNLIIDTVQFKDFIIYHLKTKFKES